MKTCKKCGSSNETDDSFCVNCGNKLSNATIGNEISQPNIGSSPAELDQLRSIPNPIMTAWDKLLYPEKMIVGGSLGVVIIILYWLISVTVSFYNFTFLALAVSPIVLVWQSIDASPAKRAEMSGWIIATCAAVASQLMFDAMGYYGYAISTYAVSFWLGFLFSILSLAGAIMLHGLLLKYFTQNSSK